MPAAKRQRLAMVLEGSGTPWGEICTLSGVKFAVFEVDPFVVTIAFELN